MVKRPPIEHDEPGQQDALFDGERNRPQRKIQGTVQESQEEDLQADRDEAHQEPTDQTGCQVPSYGCQDIWTQHGPGDCPRLVVCNRCSRNHRRHRNEWGLFDLHRRGIIMEKPDAAVHIWLTTGDQTVKSRKVTRDPLTLEVSLDVSLAPHQH